MNTRFCTILKVKIIIIVWKYEKNKKMDTDYARICKDTKNVYKIEYSRKYKSWFINLRYTSNKCILRKKQRKITIYNTLTCYSDYTYSIKKNIWVLVWSSISNEKNTIKDNKLPVKRPQQLSFYFQKTKLVVLCISIQVNTMFTQC